MASPRSKPETPSTLPPGWTPNLDTILTDRPDTVADPVLPRSRSRAAKIQEFFNTAAFAQVPLGAANPYGNTSRNSLIGPGIINTDLSAFKNLLVWRETQLQFRSEFFHLFNNVNLSNPTSVLTSPTLAALPTRRTPASSSLL